MDLAVHDQEKIFALIEKLKYFNYPDNGKEFPFNGGLLYILFYIIYYLRFT